MKNSEHTPKSLQLYQAAFTDNWDEVRILLEDPKLDLNASPSEGPNKGKTALWEAAAGEEWEIVHLLLNHPNTATLDLNANPCEGPHKGITALLYAGYYRELDIMRLLLAHPNSNTLDLNASFSDSAKGITALWYAGHYKEWDLIRLLLAHPNAATLDLNASSSEEDDIGTTALWYAARFKQWDLVHLLLAHPNSSTLDLNASPSKGAGKGITVLFLAAAYQQELLVKLLLEKGAAISLEGNIWLIKTVFKRKCKLPIANTNTIHFSTWKIIKAAYQLFDLCRVPRGRKFSEEETALLKDKLSYVLLILKNGLNAQENGITALDFAIKCNNHIVIDALLSAGARSSKAHIHSEIPAVRAFAYAQNLTGIISVPEPAITKAFLRNFDYLLELLERDATLLSLEHKEQLYLKSFNILKAVFTEYMEYAPEKIPCILESIIANTTSLDKYREVNRFYAENLLAQGDEAEPMHKKSKRLATTMLFAYSAKDLELQNLISTSLFGLENRTKPLEDSLAELIEEKDASNNHAVGEKRKRGF